MTDDEQTMIDDAQHQLAVCNDTGATYRMTPDEWAALQSARLAHDAVCETARVCETAGTYGSEVREALRDASSAMLYLIRLLEGKV